MSFFPDNSDELDLGCLARLPIQHHRTVSLTSHGVGSMIESEMIFKTRAKEGIREPIVYLCLAVDNSPMPTWFSLGKKPDKTTIASGFWLMKTKMEAFPGHFNLSMSSAGSSIFLLYPKVYSTLQYLNCGTHTWKETASLTHGSRRISTSFLTANKDNVFVIGGYGEKGELKPECYSARANSWTSLEDPPLDIKSKVFMVTASEEEELAIWSVSKGKSVKNCLDGQGLWHRESSSVFPSHYKNYSHTLFIGKLLIRVIGKKLLWFDEAVGDWRDVLARVGEVSRVRADFRFEWLPLAVVEAGESLVAFGRVGKTSIRATELILEKKNQVVTASTKWLDCVLRLPSASCVQFVGAQTVCA